MAVAINAAMLNMSKSLSDTQAYAKGLQNSTKRTNKQLAQKVRDTMNLYVQFTQTRNIAVLDAETPGELIEFLRDAVDEPGSKRHYPSEVMARLKSFTLLYRTAIREWRAANPGAA